MGSLGAPELLIILAIVLLLFGSTRLPKMARSLGQASKEFKKGIDQGAQDGDTAAPAPAEKATETAQAAEPERNRLDTPAEPAAEPAAGKAAGEAKS